MSRGLGDRQHDVLTALRGLETTYGQRRFLIHAVCRAAWGNPEGEKALRAEGTERRFNPSRVFAALAARGLVERDARYGPGASIRLTDLGRSRAARKSQPDDK
jgi:hypothetical protein